jgi:hypothetical protein
VQPFGLPARIGRARRWSGFIGTPPGRRATVADATYRNPLLSLGAYPADRGIERPGSRKRPVDTPGDT